MRLLILALTLLLAGCAPTLTYRIDGPATDEQRAALATDITKWNGVTDAKHKMRLSAKGEYRVSFPASIPTKDGPMGGRECTSTGTDCPVAPSIRVLASYTGAELLQVLLHELGHSLGMKHIDEDGALMGGPGREKAFDITERDMTECRRVKACTEKAP